MLSDSHLYPGEYIPQINAEKQKENIKNGSKADIRMPPMNLTEMPHLLKIEIALPGIQKDEIIVESRNNILTIMVCHKKKESNEHEVCTIHEFDYDKFERNIVLPTNADTSFIHAEYRSGLLVVHVPKTNNPDKREQVSIIIY